eukprot:TRINITY_DN3709_c0_g1_i10.p1 TRINITY_DN3709_c0_g1~~TRINITY_DN3709_c0_g1_i10.p1  ORF type:complete len:127 (-),score=1.14 TRINITY_DN3709_c0_g1_i10:57-437(-)
MSITLFHFNATWFGNFFIFVWRPRLKPRNFSMAQVDGCQIYIPRKYEKCVIDNGYGDFVIFRQIIDQCCNFACKVRLFRGKIGWLLDVLWLDGSVENIRQVSPLMINSIIDGDMRSRNQPSQLEVE